VVYNGATFGAVSDVVERNFLSTGHEWSQSAGRGSVVHFERRGLRVKVWFPSWSAQMQIYRNHAQLSDE